MEKKTGLMEPFLLWAVKTITMRVKKQQENERFSIYEIKENMLMHKLYSYS